MSYECRVECDSVSPDGVRLTTFVVTYPRFIHCEVMTHRMLSRNSASSRAIPVERRIAQIEADPFVPEGFGRNKKGMQAGESLKYGEADEAREMWTLAQKYAVSRAAELADLGVHKQLANRLLEPFAWHTAVITATDWANFFVLRCHPDAQPEFQRIAGMMRDAMAASAPDRLDYGGWHLPFVTPDETLDQIGGASNWTHVGPGGLSWERLKLVSAGRCCRVSYETHDGKRDPEADIALAERLIAATPKHASPLEHVATPARPGEAVKGNFKAWHQFRHQIAGESLPG